MYADNCPREPILVSCCSDPVEFSLKTPHCICICWLHEYDDFEISAEKKCYLVQPNVQGTDRKRNGALF